MARTIVALFDTADAAKPAVEDLIANAVSFDEISLVTVDIRGEYRTYTSIGENKRRRSQ